MKKNYRAPELELVQLSAPAMLDGPNIGGEGPSILIEDPFATAQNSNANAIAGDFNQPK